MTRTITEAYDVPQPDSEEALAFAKLLGADPRKGTGLLVGYASGKAAAKIPDHAKIVRVVVVAELPDNPPEGK